MAKSDAEGDAKPSSRTAAGLDQRENVHPEGLRERAVRLVFESGVAGGHVVANLGVGAESLRNLVRQTDAGRRGAC